MRGDFETKLIELENLSDEISNMIAIGDYSKILEIDKKRQSIIKNIVIENSKSFLLKVKDLRDKNTSEIQKVEKNLRSFNQNSAKSLKRFNAYSNY